ncbi:Uncharacterized protein ToN1_48020 [Aromatoleum petrolei]|nr:Uncharacterized protein ToN1_48020 [Aromatoleum petrolei]
MCVLAFENVLQAGWVPPIWLLIMASCRPSARVISSGLG